MTASVVQQVSGGIGTGSTFTLGGAPAEGNLLLFLGLYQAPSPPLNGYKTAAEGAPVTGSRVRPFIFYKVAGAAESAVQTPIDGASVVAGVGTLYEIAGLAFPHLPLSWRRDVQWHTDASFTTPFTGADLTADLDDSIALLLYGLRPSTGASPTVSAPWTQDSNGATDVGINRRWVAGSAALNDTDTITPALTSAAVSEAGYVALVIADGPEEVTPIRASQGGTLALVEGDPSLRVSQAGILAMYAPRSDVHAAQGGGLALVGFEPATRVTQAGIMALVDWVPCVTQWAQCWLFTRQDGAEFAFTSHDEAISFLGRDFSPCASLNPSATESATDLGAVGNMELRGIIDSDAISDFDLFSGLFDGCRVDVWEVPWMNDGTTPVRLASGRTGSVSQGRDGFSAEVLGLGAQMQQQAITQVVTPTCRFRFGDDRCTIDLGPLTEIGAVTGVSASASKRIFADAALGADLFEPDYFTLGVVTFTSGPNEGLRAEIKEFDATTGSFVLWTEMTVPISVADTFTVSPGCDLFKATCRDKWSNLVNYGGFPDVPGDDATSETPDAKY